MASEENNMFEVERVVGSRIYKGKIQYFIKWMGLRTEQNKWEYSTDMHCDKLVKEFEDRKKEKEVQKKKKTKAINTKKEVSTKKKANETKKSTKRKAEQLPKDTQKEKKIKKKANESKKSTKRKTEQLPKDTQKESRSSRKRNKQLTNSNPITLPSKPTESQNNTNPPNSQIENRLTKQEKILEAIQTKYILSPSRKVPNIYDSIIKKVDLIYKNNYKKMVKVTYVDESCGEMDFEIAKVGLPLHLIDYYEGTYKSKSE